MAEEVMGYFDKGGHFVIKKGELKKLSAQGYTFDEIKEMYDKKGIHLEKVKKCESGLKEQVVSNPSDTKKDVKQALLQDEAVKIVNATGTYKDHADNNIPWREFWEKKTGVKLEDVLPEKDGKYLCPGHEHHDKDDGYVEPEKICGCHVNKTDAKGNIVDKTMYITPMCSGCNKRINDIFKIGKRALAKR